MIICTATNRIQSQWCGAALLRVCLLMLLLLLFSSLPSSTSAMTIPTTSSTNIPSSTTTTTPSRRVAIVTGASRGIGRGIALELGGQGYTVYCLGRSTRTGVDSDENENENNDNNLLYDCTVESAAEQVTQRGGHGHAIPCDLSRDGVVEDLVQRVFDTERRLDVLVCAAYTTPDTTTTTTSDSDSGLRGEFWTQGLDMWDAVNGVGLRQVYAACRAAAPYMIETAASDTTTTTTTKLSSSSRPPPPLICLVSSFGGQSYTFNVAYGIGKAAIDRMAKDMSVQLAKYGVATTAIYPGLVRTEGNLQLQRDGKWEQVVGDNNLNLDQGETPAFSGKAVVELANLGKEEMMARSGKIEVVAELATEFGFNDVDTHGNVRRPPSIRSLKYLLPNFVFPQVERDAGKPIPDWIKQNVPDILLPWSTFSAGPPPESS